ncbi:MAG: hypothetical protein C4317_05925 [Acidimicrobiia bacterium]
MWRFRLFHTLWCTTSKEEPLTTIVSTAPLPALIIKGLIESALAERQRTDIAVEVLTLPERTKQAVLELAPSADILLGDYTFEIPIDAEVVGRLEKCKLIQQPSAGYQQIDIEAARRKGIPVANTGGANDVSVAEHTVMVGLALLGPTLTRGRASGRRWLWGRWVV